jgi:uncharacterized membrane protein YphA (DoxX/SURF4 family)
MSDRGRKSIRNAAGRTAEPARRRLALPLQGRQRAVARRPALARLRVAQRRLPEALGQREVRLLERRRRRGQGIRQRRVTGSTAGKGSGASYGWWAAFLHNFVLPNASRIAKVVTVSELLMGLLLILGLFTGAAAAAGVTLNLVYMFTGSAGVNPAYAIVAVLLILAWRNAGYLGLDRLVLPMIRSRFRPGPRTVTPPASPETAPSPPTVPAPVPAS